jgi:hypothetical protein
MVRVLALACLCGAIPASAAAAEPVQVEGDRVLKVDFERHIMGLLGRLGCNAGACHGSFQGKGGMRLSLFGYDPEMDYLALTRAGLGRRINPVDPDRSLLLLKATGQVAHGGGRRFARGSWPYQAFCAWIAAGAARHKGSGTVAAMTLAPDEYIQLPFQQTGQVRARARFADGSEEDITPLCDFRVQDDAVAEVVGAGRIKALRPGDTALVVSYRGQVRAIRVLVPVSAAPGFRYPQVPAVNYIDREVFAKLKRLNIVPSDLASDAEFLRRVTIDTIGCLPSPQEVRVFLADRRPDKRSRKIDELLAHPLHAALWATRLSDVTGNSTSELRAPGPLQPKFSQMWHDWLRKRLAANVPYDEIVRGILCSTSREEKSSPDWFRASKALEEEARKGWPKSYADRASLDLFYRVGKMFTLEQLGERTAAAFLGIRLECAQCHKHPFDRWTQVDYRAFANVFGQLRVGMSPEVFQIVNADKPPPKGKKTKLPPVYEVYVSPNKIQGLPHPNADPPVKPVKMKGVKPPPPPPRLPARALGGPEIPLTNGTDARLALFEWLRAPDNPYFARSFVNRVWGHYFGVGLVDPVDNFSLANPPSNGRLLDALARDFVAHKFDIRRLERTILNARVYQLSSEMNETNKLDRNNYSHSYLRPLLAEVALDVLNSALGVTENFGNDAPPGSQAIEVGASRVQSPNLAIAFRVFGRPTRATVCDCERTSEPSLPQTLFLLSDPSVLQKLTVIASPVKKGKGAPPPLTIKSKGSPLLPQDGRLATLLKSDKSDDQILEELFLATLSRFPSAAEKKFFADHRAARKASVPQRTPEETSGKKKGKKIAPAPAPTEREASFADALWALINTREFIVNH